MHARNLFVGPGDLLARVCDLFICALDQFVVPISLW
jgi:hypothetical protein